MDGLKSFHVEDHHLFSGRLRSHHGAWWSLFLLLALLLAPLGQSAEPHSRAGTLNVPLKSQMTEMWCWAACAEMVCGYFGVSITQCGQANASFGRRDCCASTPPEECVYGGWPDFHRYGIVAKRTNDVALRWNELRDEIVANKRPVIFTWHWIGTGGHMMVACGIEEREGVRWVYVRDPWEPRPPRFFRRVTYDEFVSGSDHTHWDDFYGFSRK